MPEGCSTWAELSPNDPVAFFKIAHDSVTVVLVEEYIEKVFGVDWRSRTKAGRSNVFSDHAKVYD